MKRKFLNLLKKINFRKLMFKFFRFEENYCDNEDRFSLHIRFTDKCPNKCKWCLDKDCKKGQKNASGKEMAEMANILKNREVMQISGGEPLINMKRIYEFFENINDKVKLNLNTYLPKTAFLNKDKLYKIFDRCNMIEISCQGLTNEEDEEVYKSPLKYDKHAFIKELAKRYSDKIHINYVLDKTKVQNIDDLNKFIEYFWNMGIKNFYFKEMGNTKPIQYENYISLNTILKNSKLKTLKSCFSYGCRPEISYLFNEKWPGIFVKCKRWCYFEGGNKLTIIDKFKCWLNINFLNKKPSIVLNENGKFSFWFVSD